MKKYIIDASLILHSLLGKEEKAAEKIENIFKEEQNGKTEVWSSPIIHLEVANGLRFTLKDPILSESIYGKFAKLPIRIFALNDNHLKEILSWSYMYKTTVYDTSYHFLTRLLKGIYLTCDKEYYKKAEKAGSMELVI